MSPCVVFDCDGVLLDSNPMKSAAFAQVLADYAPHAVEGFIAYQKTAFGRSRYALFRTFFEQYLQRAPLPGETDNLLSAFGGHMRCLYPQQKATSKLIETLERLKNLGVPMYVASGSDEVELREVLSQIGLATYFREIFGSPTAKDDNLKRIRAALGDSARMMFVGDARADWEASATVGCEFYYLSPWSADPQGMEDLRVLHGFPRLETIFDILPHLGGARTANVEAPVSG